MKHDKATQDLIDRCVKNSRGRDKKERNEEFRRKFNETFKYKTPEANPGWAEGSTKKT